MRPEEVNAEVDRVLIAAEATGSRQPPAKTNPN